MRGERERGEREVDINFLFPFGHISPKPTWLALRRHGSSALASLSALQIAMTENVNVERRLNNTLQTLEEGGVLPKKIVRLPWNNSSILRPPR